MFNNLENTMEVQEDLTIREDLESANLEQDLDNATEAAALTPAENAVLQDCAGESIQKMLEQYALDDQEALAELEERAAATETLEDDGQEAMTIENGCPCGSSGGCSGSTWCYGCGDLR